MTDRKIRSTPLFNQFLLILMGIALLYLAISFVRQVGVSYQRREELESMRKQSLLAKEETAELQRRLDYVQSDSAVEEWAREVGWARPDEVLLVPVWAQAEGSAEPQAAPGQEAAPASPRDAWWELFFETR